MALKSTLKNMRYTNVILEVSVCLCSSYSTVSFKTITPGLPFVGTPVDTTLTLSNRDGSLKRFRSSKSLHAFLSEVFSWPIHPDLATIDLLLTSVKMFVL